MLPIINHLGALLDAAEIFWGENEAFTCNEKARCGNGNIWSGFKTDHRIVRISQMSKDIRRYCKWSSHMQWQSFKGKMWNFNNVIIVQDSMPHVCLPRGKKSILHPNQIYIHVLLNSQTTAVREFQRTHTGKLQRWGPFFQTNWFDAFSDFTGHLFICNSHNTCRCRERIWVWN